MTMWELDYLLRNEAAGDVLVMGAGFSFAVDEAFPLTDRLGQLAVVASSLDMPRRRERGIYQMSLSDLGALIPENQPNFVGGTFETWMSYLAEPQPFLAPVERAQNHAQFLGFVRSIWEVLTLVEKEASRRGLPPWLYRLLSALHARQATVVTFNYDRLLEAGIEQLELQDFGQKPSDARVL